MLEYYRKKCKEFPDIGHVSMVSQPRIKVATDTGFIE